jgi:hypothetical protein
MSENKTLKAIDRKIFKSYFDDGLLDFFLAAFVLMFAIAPLLSGTLGDFWSSAIFLPFWGLVYLILLTIRRRVIAPRIGSVKWGEMRKKKLRTGSLILIVINVIFLVFGIVFSFMPIQSGYVMSIRFSVMVLVLFSGAGYMLDFNFLYVYGIMITLAMPVGEWLYQTAGFSHHGYPAVFGTVAGIMFLRGLYKFIKLLKDNPTPLDDQPLTDYKHG